VELNDLKDAANYAMDCIVVPAEEDGGEIHRGPPYRYL
jgi:hypothetical protein